MLMQQKEKKYGFVLTIYVSTLRALPARDRKSVV